MLNRTVRGALQPAMMARAVATLGRLAPDLILVLKCDDLPPLFYKALRRVCRGHIAAFHPDDPWNGSGWLLRRGSAHRNAIAQMHAVDTMFLWSQALVARARGRGVNAHYLPFACDPELHPPTLSVDPVADARYAADVVFVGNWEPERERILAPLAESGVDLAIWGASYWRDRCRHPPLRKAWRGRELVGEEQTRAIKTSRLCINVLRLQNKGSTNMRTFEIPCMGGFLLHEASAEAAAFFPPDVAAAYFDGPDDLVRAVRHWLAAPSAVRTGIASEGQRRALTLTYRDWAASLLEAVGLNAAS
jgi:spore maturation protein CgeB